MVSCGPTQSYRIPLKNCQGSVIDHHLVSIQLSVEWPDKLGDNPNLVIHVTNKQPSTLYQSSVPVNSVHPQYQHQENVCFTYPQQQYYHSSTINNHNLSSPTVASTISDHDDVSSTTTSTLVYNSIQPQSQTLTSSTAIEQIKNHLQSGLSPLLQHQQYPPTQHVIQTSSTNMNDSRLNVKMSTFSPRSSIQLLPSMPTQFVDLQQQSTPLKPSPIKSVVCTCPNPTIYHVHNCAIFASINQESNTNLSSEAQHTTFINRTNTERCVSASHVPTNSVNLLPSMKESMITTTFLPNSNSNFMNTRDSSSSVTTIISQTPSFLNNSQIGQTIKTPSLDTNNIFQQPSLNVSQVIINNNPSNYQTNPPMPSVGQQNTVTNNSRQPKKLIKRNSLTNQDQTLFQNLNNSQQQIHFLSNQNSPTKQQNINPTHHLSSPIQTQQGMFIHQDNSQITDKTLCGSTNDIVLNTTQQQQSPRLNSMVRSPVKLEISGSQHLNQVKLTPEAAMDQTISDVVKGKGDISIGNSLKSTAPQQHQRPSLSTQLVRESIGPTPTTRTICVPLHQEQQLSTTYDSNISTLSRPNVADITQQVIRPNSTEESKMNTLTKQPAKNNNKKRNQLKSMNNTVSKRTYKSTVNIQQQQTIMSSSHQDISQTRTSPVTSTSNIITKQNSWSDTPKSSSSSESVTDPHNVNPNQRSTNDPSQMPDISDLLDFDEDMTIIYQNDDPGIELKDLFPQKIDGPFVSSTPPPIPSITMLTSIRNSIMKQPSGEKLSNTLLTSTPNPADIFDTYFLSDPLYSSVACEENQVTSSVETPPDPQNNHLPQQQHYPSTDSNRESQTLTSQFIETKPTIVNQMNHNDDVQTRSKRQQQQQQQHTKKFVKTNNKSLKHPSKIIKKQNRPNLIKKQTSKKPSCTRCGLTQLVDITHHEFPKQKGLVFECTSCGNNSIRSNVSADERRRRLAKVAADHLNTVVCQFCHKFFHSHNDYLTHLKDDHKSNKPM